MDSGLSDAQDAPRAQLRERTGELVGRLIAPAFKAGSKLRPPRIFHPCGATYLARVTPATEESRESLRAGWAERLGSHAIVRFSGGIWKHAERRPEILGCAVRFCDPGEELHPSANAQDLVFATLRFPWTLPLALWSTEPHDFLANVYYGASPFKVEGNGVLKLRARPIVPGTWGTHRAERLRRAVDEGAGRLVIEFKHHFAPSRWRPLVNVELTEHHEVDDAALRFNPFRDGRGLRPLGFVQGTRRRVYAASQRA